MVASYKSVGVLAATSGTSVAVPVPAGAAGDYAVIDLFVGASESTPAAPANWALAYSEPNGAGGSRHVYWRAFTGTVSAGNVTFTVPAGGAYGKCVMFSAAGTGAPTVITPTGTIGTAVSYWQGPAITTGAPRAAVHFGFIDATRTQGALSNQGTITSTNTSRGSNESILGAYCLHTATSAITSASGGSVRGAFSGGTTTSWTFTVLIPEPVPATPTGLDVAGGADEVTGSFTSVAGATGYRARYRQTSITRPSVSTQSSAPSSLDRLDDATGLDGTYTYRENGAGRKVYVADSGCTGTHTQFTGRVASGFAIPGAGSPTTDADPGPGHGTQVASVVLGTTSGVAKGATLVPVKMYVGTETSSATTDWDAFDDLVSDIITDAAGEHHVVSFSGFWPRNNTATEYTQVTAAFQSLVDAGLTVVIAAGNENEAITIGPEWDDMIIVGGTVASTDARWDDGVDWGSVWSPGIDIFAVGKDVSTALKNGTTGTGTGTSFAQPAVAGVAAKILETNPGLSPARVKEMLEAQARQGILTGTLTSQNRLLNSDTSPAEWTTRDLGAVTAFAITGLGADTTWEVQVQAYNANGDSAWSTSGTATTDAAEVPAPPVHVGSTQVDAIYVGEHPVTAIYRGSDLIWSAA